MFGTLEMKVRTNYDSGKLLFDWNPDENTIGIVQKDMFYRVQLLPKSGQGEYRIVEKRPKNEPPPQAIL